MHSRRLIFEWLALLCLSIAAVVMAYRAELTAAFDNRLLDISSTLARPAIDERIVIIAIDDRSIEALGTWPWDRAVHAELVDALAEKDAERILYDVLFLDPSDPAADTALQDAIDSAGNVILPHSFIEAPNSVDGLVPAYPLPSLAGAAEGVGHVLAVPDSDGVLRRYDLGLLIDGQRYPHFAAVAASGEGRETAARTELIAHYPPSTFPTVSAADVISGSVPQGFLQSRIVLVGATAQGMGDRYSVASGPVTLMSGVETQANLVNAVLSGHSLKPIGLAWSTLVAVAALVALFVVFWIYPPRLGLFALLALLAMALLLSLGLLIGAGLWLAPGPLLAMMLLAYPLWNWRRLSVVSAFLDRQAQNLGDGPGDTGRQSGFDYVSSQVARMRTLVGQVRQSEDFLRKVIEAAPDAIVVFDRDERAVMMNAAADALFLGWEDSDRPSFQELLLAADGKRESDTSVIVLAGERFFALSEARLEDMGLPKTANQGGAIISLHEITAQRRRQEERRQMLEFLSHDMRSPQAAIINLTSDPSSAGCDPALLARVRSQAERTLSLADNFVQLARLEEARISLVDTELVALAMEACDRAYANAKAADVTIEQLFPDDPQFALVDPSLVARAIDNLLSNAIKFSAAGEVVTVTLRPEPDHLYLDVADNGPGLPPERMEDPFGRFGAHDTKAGPSVGLGLAFVKRVADIHGIPVTVKSSADDGTRFTLRFAAEAG